jgi:hypothetical protein
VPRLRGRAAGGRAADVAGKGRVLRTWQEGAGFFRPVDGACRAAVAGLPLTAGERGRRLFQPRSRGFPKCRLEPWPQHRLKPSIPRSPVNGTAPGFCTPSPAVNGGPATAAASPVNGAEDTEPPPNTTQSPATRTPGSHRPLRTLGSHRPPRYPSGRLAYRAEPSAVASSPSLRTLCGGAAVGRPIPLLPVRASLLAPHIRPARSENCRRRPALPAQPARFSWMLIPRLPI